MHVHIATMGKVQEPIKKAFNAIPGIDRVYLIGSSKYEESAEELKAFFTSGMASCEIVYVTGFDFQEIVSTIYRIYETERGKNVEFSINITGGTNLMAAAACSCAFFIGAEIYYVNWDPSVSIREQLIHIPTPKTPELSKIKGKTRTILKFILERTEKGCVISNSNISSQFDIDKQNSSYHLKILAGEGLIRIEKGYRKTNGQMDNRRNTIILTEQGRIVANWLE